MRGGEHRSSRWDMFWYNLITRLSSSENIEAGKKKLIVESCRSLEGFAWVLFTTEKGEQHLFISPLQLRSSGVSGGPSSCKCFAETPPKMNLSQRCHHHPPPKRRHTFERMKTKKVARGRREHYDSINGKVEVFAILKMDLPRCH